MSKLETFRFVFIFTIKTNMKKIYYTLSDDRHEITTKYNTFF